MPLQTEVEMPKRSAGVLLYRYEAGNLLVLLVHPGGPFWNEQGSARLSIPKGEYDADEGAGSAARREFLEETASR